MTLITDIDVNTPIYRLSDEQIPNLYVKREDLIPYSFGGNKARKAILFMEDYDRGDYDYMVTYGSSHSNHCRVIANICAGRNIPCLAGKESPLNLARSAIVTGRTLANSVLLRKAGN